MNTPMAGAVFSLIVNIALRRLEHSMDKSRSMSAEAQHDYLDNLCANDNLTLDDLQIPVNT
jgi:hypothetical protein